MGTKIVNKHFVNKLVFPIDACGVYFALARLQELPSDTKLLLTKNYSEIINFGKITNLTRNSLKMSFFPGHFESTKSLKNYEK